MYKRLSEKNLNLDKKAKEFPSDYLQKRRAYPQPNLERAPQRFDYGDSKEFSSFGNFLHSTTINQSRSSKNSNYGLSMSNNYMNFLNGQNETLKSFGIKSGSGGHRNHTVATRQRKSTNNI
jgi:hypothetical protein